MAAARAAGGDPLRLDPSRLRFSLGTSVQDVRIPVQVAPDARDIARAAASQLSLLLVTQHRHFVPVDDLDRAMLAEGYASLPAPAATLGPSSGGADLRAAAELGAAAHPALTGGLLCAWMGPGGRGRSLTALFIEVLREAFREMEASRESEETPLIAALALDLELRLAEGGAREALPAPPTDRYLRAATFAGLWVAARTGLSRVLRAREGARGDPLAWKLEAVLAPGPLLGGRAGGSTLYGCELAAAVPRGEELVSRLAGGADPDAAVADLALALGADEELALRAEAAVAVAHLRRMVYAGVAAAEAEGRGGHVAFLRDLYSAPAALASVCAADGARREIASRLAHGARLSGEAGQALEWVGRALSTWDPREPAACVGLPRAAALAEYALAAGAVAADAALERLIAGARRALVPRTGAEAEGGADAEWEEGRLYRISARPGPLLKKGPQRPLGHLFADVKDFTRRTALLGPAPMAEFLRTEFYRPILVAAKGFYAGMPHLSDRGGITVNNLLGDAISISGDIEALLALAAETRRLLAAYEVRLSRQVSSEMVGRYLAGLVARHERELARLAELRAAAAAEGAPALRLGGFEEEERRLTEEHALALARARGEGIEAGIFVSYGPAPVTVLIDDEVFGTNRVAIAEKINESARGTSRTSGARRTADAALKAERAARGDEALPHAFSVFVGADLKVEFPPDLERAALAAAREGDLPTALRYLGAPLRKALEAALSEGDTERPGELYNSGVALSEDALTHFLDAVKSERHLRRVVLSPQEVPEELRRRYFFGAEPLELVATFRLDGRPAELFRRAGLAAFRGLGTVAVWELASDTGGPAELFEKLGPSWLAGPGPNGPGPGRGAAPPSA